MMPTFTDDPERIKRWEREHEISKALRDASPEERTREWAGRQVVAMLEAWETIHSNFNAEDVGFGDTPEEIRKFEDAMILAGEGILALADLLLESEL